MWSWKSIPFYSTVYRTNRTCICFKFKSCSSNLPPAADPCCAITRWFLDFYHFFFIKISLFLSLKVEFSPSAYVIVLKTYRTEVQSIFDTGELDQLHCLSISRFHCHHKSSSGVQKAKFIRNIGFFYVICSVADPGCLSRSRIFFYPGSEIFTLRIRDPHQRI